MAGTALAKPYATAVLDLAIATDSLSTVREQLESVVRALRSSRELRVAFQNPTLSVADRKRVVEALVGRMALSTTTRSFLLVLADKGRLGALEDIVEMFGHMADERTGHVRARVVSGVPISAAQQLRLQVAIGELTGKKVAITNDVDPTLIGGLQVHVGGKVYDTSVATQLRTLREAILSRM